MKPAPKTIAETIRTAREKLGLTQGQLAATCNVSIGTVNRWENGATPDPRNLNILAVALGVCVSDLIPRA